MSAREEDAYPRRSPPAEDVLHIAPELGLSPMSPTSKKRFIVEPQVLNAALEYEESASPVPSPSPRTAAIHGLPPPPRPNSRKGRSYSVNPADGDISIAAIRIPNSPLSSPYSNSPDTPPMGPVQDEYYERKSEELPTVYPWSPREQGEETSSPQSSFQGSLPPSPEMAVIPVDGSRPTRQNRYLTGLQKITKFGKTKSPINMFADSGLRNARRLSEAELDTPRTSGMKKTSGGSEDLSSRYRRMLDKGVRTAGELIKPSTSVPSSPVLGPVKSVSMGEREDERGRSSSPCSGLGFRADYAPSASATRPSAVATQSIQARGSLVATSNPSPRVWRSHGRRPSANSSSSHPTSPTFSPSSSSHERSSSSSAAEPRISISSTIYPDSSNNHSFDIARYPHNANMPAVTPDRESFIDLASPTFSPMAAEFSFNAKPTSMYIEQSTPPHARSSTDSRHGKSSPRSTSPPRSSLSKPRLERLIPPEKPPVPTAPKPDFSYRSRSGNRSSPIQPKKAGSLATFAEDVDPSLPTFSASNALTPRERAERIRTTRKLTQVFGQPPGISPVSASPQEADVLNGCMPMPGPLALNLSAKRRQHRPAIPDDYSFIHTDPSAASMSSLNRNPSSVIDIGSAQRRSPSDTASSVRTRRGRAGAPSGSPTSFMDLSDEEGATDSISEILSETPKASRGHHPFSSTASLAESVSSDRQAEEERRRKREKLAKLHRFLGHPAPAPAFTAPNDDDDDDIRKGKMRRRRSSSAAEFSRTWSDDIDRLKEELNEREKAINVRRAVKMEKMFGVAPPQTLYHTRAPVASSPNIAVIRQPSPSIKNPPRSPATPPYRFTTTSAGPSYKAKSKKRPGTSDSSQPLIDDANDDGLLHVAQSSIYLHYRHSLNSLNDIIDRDDKESLAELHDYLTGDHYKTGDEYDYQFAASSSSNAAAPSTTSPVRDDFAVATPTAAGFTSKPERRRSLPSRVSIASFSSEISTLIAPTPTEPSFQQRRRRAAKLTHFFGVDYRDLMGEILDSIEKGLEEESGKGTLRPDEVRDLQQKLVSLKTKRASLSR
ncbi:hypothetical protein C8Q80DRAFT_1129175 [Daedaleopsis nitida]|nr:hypothetical protein C8Q80DRAFT_1129175 [Daedaleopsis nitida]